MRMPGQHKLDAQIRTLLHALLMVAHHIPCPDDGIKRRRRQHGVVRHCDDELPFLPCFARLPGDPCEAFFRKAAFAHAVGIVVQCEKPVSVRKLNDVAHALPVHGNRLIRPKGAVQLP